MPNDNIERAILRGTGGVEGNNSKKLCSRATVPVVVGMLVQVVTNNRNRTVAICHLMSKGGGNLAESGAVGWQFSAQGDISVPKDQADEEKMIGIVLDVVLMT